MRTETPVKASTVVFVTPNQIIQRLRYFYFDQDRIYRKYELTGCLDGELERMSTNLQIYLEQDAVFLNETDCNLQVCEVGYHYLRKDFSKILVEFMIYSKRYKIHLPTNEIKMETELENAPYPCYSVWHFPGEVLAVESRMRNTIKGNRVLLRTTQGEWIGGDERFEFHFDPYENSKILFGKAILLSE
ncbi:MAG: hypothetical protein ACFFB3_11530 [Candidatus Hodarchaeota archaeon]